jgi:hypothetical protein
VSNSPSTKGAGRLILKWERGALTAGCVAWVLCVLGLLLGSPAQFFRAYLAAYTFFLGIALGGMAILMISHLTGGAWAYLIRRILEAQMSTLPLIALMFIPLAFGLEPLYLWARPELVAADPQLHAQQFWLNKPFFLIRAAIYFAIWLLIAFALALRSRRQERTGDPTMPWKFMRLSEVGLVLYGTTMHFAAFDWLEMLQPNYHSTIFPMLVASSQLFSAQAFALVVLVALSLRSEAAAVVSTRVLTDLGNILLAFLIICAYMLWFQFMLGWIANQPADALWFLPRVSGGWRGVAWAIFIVQFAVPLFLLLMRAVKSSPRSLLQLAAVVLFMQLVFVYYLVVPPFQAASLTEHWLDFVTPFAVGGIWLGYFLERFRRRAVLAPNDPNRESAVHLRHLDEEDIEREHALSPSEA